MDVGRDYRLPFKGLEEGSHQYSFDLPGLFFEHFSSTEIRTGNLTAEVELIKRSSFLELQFHVEGFVEVVCDRCLEYYKQPIQTDARLFVKFGELFREESEELVIIPVSETELDLSHYLYEFVLLGIPYRKVHPEDEKGNPGCDPDMLRRLKELSVETEEQPDPRWDKLKELNIKKK